MKLFIIALTMIMTAGVNDDATGPIDPPGTSIKPLPTSVNKTVLLQLVNDVRKKGCKCGDTYYGSAPAVKWNDQLATAAVGHSEDMYRKKFFAHVAPDGSNGGIRVKRAGYPWMAYGENIAAGYTSEKEVIKGWIESPGHCKNIMSKLYKEMGVGRYGNYWTQEFGAR